MTFSFIRDPETRLACQRLLLLADLRQARSEHKPTVRIRRAVEDATRKLMEMGNERKMAAD